MKPYWWVFAAALLLRVGIILYTSHLDSQLIVKYTDIDYAVYSDAARIVLENGSPYARSTYRYSPILAFFMFPNVWYKEFGKMLFAVLDIVAGVLLSTILLEWGIFSNTKRPGLQAIGWTCIWLFNPIVINMSTRGSADVIAIALIFYILLSLLRRQYHIAAIMYGFTVHFRIYPIVYAPAFYLYVGYQAMKAKYDNTITKKQSQDRSNHDENHVLVSPSPQPSPTPTSFSPSIVSLLFNAPSIYFGLIAASTFFALLASMYYIYGYEFLYETYLYHFVRKDIRHNFSPYFYFLYLSSSPQPSIPTTSPIPSVFSLLLDIFTESYTILLDSYPFIFSSSVFSFIPNLTSTLYRTLSDLSGSNLLNVLEIPWYSFSPELYIRIIQTLPPLIAFLPQFSSLLIVALCLYRDLPACILIQTLVFVAFNKVCTAQYFLWWISILPLVLPLTLRASDTNYRTLTAISLSRVIKTGIVVATWFIAEVSWLLTGLYREVYGRQVYLFMWAASLVFFFQNIFIIYVILKHHRWLDFQSVNYSNVQQIDKKKQ